MRHSPLSWLIIASLLFLSCTYSYAQVPAAYGSWSSTITTDMMTKGARKFTDLSVDGDTVYWVESRPDEDGRHVIMKYNTEEGVKSLFPEGSEFSALTSAHDYGGGALLAARETIYFANATDRRIWRIMPDQPPAALTAEHQKYYFTDFCLDQSRNRLIVIAEEHPQLGEEAGEDVTKVVNSIMAVDLASGELSTLVSGADFYSTPRISPDSNELAWICWNHPDMPWDQTVLHRASLDQGGNVIQDTIVAGGSPLDESIMQPTWSPDGKLYFVSDRSNWWNIHNVDGDCGTPVTSREAEFGVPHWEFGHSAFSFSPDNTIYAAYNTGGVWHLSKIDTTYESSDIETPYTSLSHVHYASGQSIYAIASAPDLPPAIVKIDIENSRHKSIIRSSSTTTVDERYISDPEAIEFPTEDNKTAHAFYYSPTNPDYCGLADTLPPLIIMIHGGPTSAATQELNLGILYWTSRGFAVCDVNYGGSTGYGREYRKRLENQWGIIDVEDASNAAKYLADQGKVNAEQFIIRGRSAGGYTTLACLAFIETFCCGTSCCGVSDLELLTKGTHKFESRYLDGLVGPLPDAQATYKARAPINYVDDITCPILLMQGQTDKVVPPDQAETIYQELNQKGRPVAYVKFENEGHRIKFAENIKKMYENELTFYSQILHVDLPDSNIPLVEIENFHL